MATYLVTGGAGFIGSHLTDTLIADGHSVRVIDNFLTGNRENLNPSAEFFEADLRDLNAIRAAFVGVDTVFHLAALPRVQESIEHPLETHEHNVNATLNVLLAAKEAGVRRVVYSASCSAYGDGHTIPLKEEYLPMPMSPYGLQKYIGEHYARVFSLAYGMETVSLRYFNVYGPRMSEVGSYVSVMSVFVKAKRNGTPLTITGDGTQTRDFTFVSDVVQANILASRSEKVGKGEVVNIGAGRNLSVNKIAELFGGVSTYIAPRLEPHDALADTTRAQTLLGWTPLVSAEEGIAKVKAFYSIT